ncbi:hypothetical protein ABZ777_15615 [Micromonospora parva]|uniref:hypothetical protein n=1 Tax=Micromonospora parva TaxID=1464048 RepID=UPI0033E5D3AC
MQIPIDLCEQAFGWDPDQPNHHGFLIVEPGTPPVLLARIRPGLDGELLDLFVEWALRLFARFLKHGPEPDGWERRSDGAWQAWARLHQMPTLRLSTDTLWPRHARSTRGARRAGSAL